MMNNTNETNNMLAHVSNVVAAYVKAHKVDLEDISHAITRIYQAFKTIENNSFSLNNMTAKAPAVPIEESVFDDYIICLEDGKQLQMLKRHLSTMYGMTLEQYKERWNLPHDYPVVSPSYARRRSAIAKSSGLGKTGRKGRGRLKAVAA